MYNRSLATVGRRLPLTATVFTLAALFLFPSSTSFGVGGPPELGCETAEVCFRAARLRTDLTVGEEDPIRAEVARLKLVRERHPGTLWAKRAGLRIGVLLAERDPSEAMLFLRAAQWDFPLLDDYVRLWMGKSLLRQGKSETAAAFFESIPETVSDTLLGTRAAFGAGEAWARAGACSRAIPLLTQAVTSDPENPAAPAAWLTLAECQVSENLPQMAFETWKELWARYPQVPESKIALARLKQGTGGEGWQPSPEVLYRRATTLVGLFLNEEAVEEFQRFLAVAKDHPQRGLARLKLGTALVRLKRYPQARQMFQELVAERSAEADEAQVWLVRIFIRQGDQERVQEIDRSRSKLPLSGPQRAAVLMYLGSWWEDRDNQEEAIARYQQVVQGGDVFGQSAEALWRIGWIHYRAGRFQDAVRVFQDALKSKDGGEMAPHFLYWTARALERQQDSGANEVYQNLCRDYPYTYYCQLAQARVEAIRAVFLTPRDSNGDALPLLGEVTEMAQDLHYRRAKELKAVGLEEDAARELAALGERYARDRSSLAELSVLLHDAGAYHHALRLARLYFRDSLERGGGSVPKALWSAAYPTGYLPTIRAHAGTQMDPFLAAAVIREESHYDVRAVSFVGAVGLMQLMPATAQSVARRLGLPEVMREDLFDHQTNIRFGVEYLGQLLKKFSGNAIHAVAAYNAGPVAVSSWIQKFGDREADEFIEMIPYQETRRYVKRVLRSYREYHRLEGSECAIRFLDKVC